jgi:hypothetical protein
METFFASSGQIQFATGPSVSSRRRRVIPTVVEI